VPAEKIAAQIPTATARWAGSTKMVRIRARVEGSSVAPATPSRARVAMRLSALVANAASTDAKPKVAAPIRSTRRRPMRSPRVPIVISNPATMNP
jgi:hypothetical protein